MCSFYWATLYILLQQTFRVGDLSYFQSTHIISAGSLVQRFMWFYRLWFFRSRLFIVFVDKAFRVFYFQLLWYICICYFVGTLRSFLLLHNENKKMYFWHNYCEQLHNLHFDSQITSWLGELFSHLAVTSTATWILEYRSYFGSFSSVQAQTAYKKTQLVHNVDLSWSKITNFRTAQLVSLFLRLEFVDLCG